MKTLNDILEECAHESGFPTYLYARMGEANVIIDHVTQYPALLRAFTETVYETQLATTRRRRMVLYFCDALGAAEPSTSYSVAPIIEKMENRAFGFVNGLRGHGIEVDVQSATPFVGELDALMAGLRMELTITYSTC